MVAGMRAERAILTLLRSLAVISAAVVVSGNIMPSHAHAQERVFPETLLAALGVRDAIDLIPEVPSDVKLGRRGLTQRECGAPLAATRRIGPSPQQETYRFQARPEWEGSAEEGYCRLSVVVADFAGRAVFSGFIGLYDYPGDRARGEVALIRIGSSPRLLAVNTRMAGAGVGVGEVKILAFVGQSLRPLLHLETRGDVELRLENSRLVLHAPDDRNGGGRPATLGWDGASGRLVVVSGRLPGRVHVR